MKRLLLLSALLIVSRPFCSAEGFDAKAFSPKEWPGLAPKTVIQEVLPLASAFTEAMRAGEQDRINNLRDKIIEGLGQYAGSPEERPAYGAPPDSSEPDLDRVTQAWSTALLSLKGRFGWEQAKRLESGVGSGGKVPRLRVSERQIRSLLQTHEAGLDPEGELLRNAIAGLDYLLTAQSSNGVFGYPYDPDGPGLRKQAAHQVHKGEGQGIKMVEREWVIEDLGNGGLNFDNGVCGAVLLQGYAITGHERYLDAALRAGEWAKSRALTPNFNYNGFSGVLCARLFRATTDPAWLAAAKRIFEHGVLSGQMPNGRWFDQHNAKIQYHAILCSQTAEYLQALTMASDPAAIAVEKRLRLALDNLAQELLTYGNGAAEEGLSLGALSYGVMVLGAETEWVRASNVAVNYFTGHFTRENEARGRHGLLPESMGCWLLQRVVAKTESGLNPSELRPQLRR